MIPFVNGRGRESLHAMPIASFKFRNAAIKARFHNAKSAPLKVSPSVAAVLGDMFGMNDADIAHAASRVQAARAAGIKLRFGSLTTGRLPSLLPK